MPVEHLCKAGRMHYVLHYTPGFYHKCVLYLACALLPKSTVWAGVLLGGADIKLSQRSLGTHRGSPLRARLINLKVFEMY